jgi:replicative DNA helicase
MSGGNKMVWLDRTEIVMGLILNGDLNPNLVNADDFIAPYNEAVTMLRKGSTVEDIIANPNIGFSAYQAATMAANAVLADAEQAKKKPIDWLHLLEQAASFYKYGQELATMADKLMMGQPIDPGKLLQFASNLDLGHRTLTPLDQIEPEAGQWIKTGYEPIDNFIGGVPKAGLTVLAGGTGIGKTTLALRIGLEMLRLYDGKKNSKKKGPKYGEKIYTDIPAEKGKIAIFSLEMLLSQVVRRFLDLDSTITKEERSRMLGTESAYTVGEIYAVAARAAASENLKAIIIDFADMLVEGEQSEAVMGVIYRSLAVLAKTTGVPVILICQLNRNQYQGGIPKINHIRYSGMAEMMSALIMLLYNPSSTVADVQANSILPFYPDKGYIIVGKSRFGFLMGKPGAVQVEFKGETGWGNFGFGYWDVHV